MIKFLKKIRQNLLSEEKIESILNMPLEKLYEWVIGILIALQINNWNENRKSAIQ